MLSDSWQALGNLPVAGLKEARLELHRAAQLAACPGQSLLPKRPDDSQMALSWKAGVLMGEPLTGELRVGLALADLSLEVRDGRGGLGGRLPLNGRTQEEALKWLKVRLGSSGVDTSSLNPQMPFEMPGHLLAKDAAFTAESSASLSALADWYAAAADVLAEVAGNHESASALRCWPHHFDLATLQALDPDADAGMSRTIGIGFSPGDGSYGEPYFYVTPWPYPKGVDLPALPAGHWHTEHWTGAVMTGSELVALEGWERRERCLEFLNDAVQACRGLLG